MQDMHVLSFTGTDGYCPTQKLYTCLKKHNQDNSTSSHGMSVKHKFDIVLDWFHFTFTTFSKYLSTNLVCYKAYGIYSVYMKN